MKNDTYTLSLEKNLKALGLGPIAKQSDWSLHANSKITALSWCQSLCLGSAGKQCSLRIVAFFLGLKGKLTTSKQSVDKRLDKGGAQLLLKVLEKAVALKTDMKEEGSLNAFSRVILQDSTCLALPKALREDFPGSANQAGATASMRIQACFEMKEGRFIDFKLGSFRDNDQGASREALTIARKGDLLLRDLGYFSLEAFREYIEKEVHLLTRLRLDTHLFDPKTKKRIDLLRILKSNRSSIFDRDVLVGATSKLKMRLVAIPVPQKVADERRRKLRANRDARTNPGRVVLALQGWQIFLTTAAKEQLPTEEIAKLYAIRWRIETLFKSWKSSLGIGAFHPRISAELARALTYAALLRITLMHSRIMPGCLDADCSSKYSILKFSSLIGIIQLADELRSVDEETLKANLKKHSLYEKRNRRNLMQLWGEVAAANYMDRAA